jgi:hypothetical protein
MKESVSEFRLRWEGDVKLDVREIPCGSGWNALSVSCEHGSEAFDVIKCRQFLDKLSDFQPL